MMQTAHASIVNLTSDRAMAKSQMSNNQVDRASSSFFKHRVITSERTKKLITNQAINLDMNRVVHYKKGKYVGSGYYIIEISSS